MRHLGALGVVVSATVMVGAAAEARPGWTMLRQEHTRVVDLSVATAAEAVYGAPDKDQLGNDLAVGDANGDGTPDLVIGAHLGSMAGRNNAGRAYVLFGDGEWPAVRDLASTGAADWSFVGVGLEPRLGSAVASGDLQSDGIDDIVLGSLLADPPDPGDPGRSLPNAGTVSVLLGHVGAGGSHDLLLKPPDALFAGDSGQGSDQLGTAAAVGDLDGDGDGDLVAAAAMRGGQTGAVFVEYGPIQTGRLQYIGEAPVDWWIVGPGTRASFGVSLVVGELNGDGLRDLVVGSAYAAPGEATDTGAIHVFYGRPLGQRLGEHDLAKTQADVTIIGDPGSYLGVAFSLGLCSCRGQSLAIADVTGDGIADLVVGAPSARQRRGEVVVLPGPLPDGRHDVATLPRFRLLGTAAEGRLGWDVAAAHLDGDGQRDLVVAAPWASAPGREAAGVALGYRGPLPSEGEATVEEMPADLTVLGPATRSGTAGMSVALADTDGDGRQDLHLGYPDMAPLGRRSVGALYRVRGPLIADLPTATPTSTETATATATTTATFTASATPTSTATGTSTPEPTATTTASPTDVHLTPTPSPTRGIAPAYIPLVLARP